MKSHGVRRVSRHRLLHDLSLLPLEVLIVIYLGITAAVLLIAGFREPDLPVRLLVRFAMVLAIFLLSLTESALKSSRPVKLVRRYFPYLLLGYLYNEIAYFNGLLYGFNLDRYIAAAEETIFGLQPALVFSQHVSSDLFAELMYLGYFSYYLMVFLVPLFIYLMKGEERGEKWVFIIISSFLLYYLFFMLVPVSGPQFYFQHGLEPLPEGYFFGNIQGYILTNFEVAAAAFPSSHVSVYLMIIWACRKELRKWLIPALCVALLLIPATVYLRAHYVLDVIVAFLFTPIVYLASQKLYQALVETKSDRIIS